MNGIVSVGNGRKSLYFPTVVVVSSYTRRRLVFPGSDIAVFYLRDGRGQVEKISRSDMCSFCLASICSISSDGISDGSAWRRGSSSFVATF